MTRVRGVRSPNPAGFVVGRSKGQGQGSAQFVSISSLGTILSGSGAVPPAASFISAVDSNFTVTGGTLSLHTAADNTLISNISGGTAEPIANGLSAVLDHVMGSTEGQILQRGASAWQVLATGTANQVLSSGGAAALNSWAGLSALLDAVFGNTEGNVLQRGASAWQVLAPGTSGQVLTSGGAGALNSWTTTGSFNSRGAWGGNTAYAPFDVVTYNGSSWLCYSTVAAPGGSPPTLDGSIAAAGHATSATCTLSTTLANDVIVVIVYWESSTAGSTAPHVNTVTDTATLSYSKRAAYNVPLASHAGGNMEIWWAPSTGILTNDVITVTSTGGTAAVDDYAIVAFGVHGSSLSTPWDPNVSIPAEASNGAPPSVTISTTDANDMIIAAVGATNNTAADVNGGPTGYTHIANAGTSLGGLFAEIGAAYKAVTTNQSSVAVAWNASPPTGSGPSIYIVDALTNGSTPNTPPPLDDTHWIAQGSYVGTPGGRLSMSSGVAVQTADVVGGTTIYYLPYQHVFMPLIGIEIPTSGWSLGLNTSNHLSGKVYDIFLYNSQNSVLMGTGPAWTSTSARGSGAGTTQIDQSTVPGIWTNTNTMTLTYGASGTSTISIAAGTGLFVGTFYASANGQCTCQFFPAGTVGGNNTIMGLANIYNQRQCYVSSNDTTASWTYNSTTVGALNGSASNRINWVDPLGTTFALVDVGILTTQNASSTTAVQIDFNVTAPSFTVNASAAASVYMSLSFSGRPVLGFNFAALSQNTTGTGGTYFGGANMSFSAELLY